MLPNRLPSAFFVATPFPVSDLIRTGRWLFALCLAPALLQALGMDFGAEAAKNGPLVHSLLEWTSVCAASLVGALAFVHFRVTKESSLPVIGMAMLCAGALDMFHVLASEGLLGEITDPASFAPFIGTASRLVSGLVCLFGVGLFALWLEPGRRFSTVSYAVIGGGFALASLLLMQYGMSADGLPRSVYANEMIKRPLEMYPLAVYLLCGALVFPLYYRHHASPFALSLVLMMVPQAASQLYMAFASSMDFDAAFNIAHGLKAIGWLVPAGGLLAEFSDLFQREREIRERCEAAEARAIQAAKSKSEFLSSISQEIRTPMAGVIGMADLLMTSALDNAQADAAETIAGSAGAVLALIDDVQDFSQLESGFVELAEQPLAPRRLLDGILELLSVQSLQNKVRMNAFADPEVPARVIGDEKRLRQILLKLTSNALRHTRDGEVNLQCEFVEEGYTHVVLRFHVSDTGSGIPDDKRAAILRSFSQSGQEDGHAYGGNGLGLAVTRQMVRLMGGSIWVESTVGQGTSFVFTVRLSRDLDERRQPRVIEEWQGKRLLLAAGSPIRGSRMKRQLESWGFQVTVANDAWDALRELRATLLMEQCFDLALIDHDIPGRSGEELCQEFRAAEGASEMKLLLISAPGELSTLDQPYWDYRLQTPIKFGSLHNVLQRACNVPRSPLYDRRNADGEEPEAVADGLKVLVAEDDPVNQKVLAKLLERLGCEVDRVCNGEEATERVQTGNYHLVFMDCNMPGLNGFDATRLIRLRETGTAAHTIIIAMTSNARASTREQCLEAGMDDYITKPIRASVLAEALDRWKAGDGAMTEV